MYLRGLLSLIYVYWIGVWYSLIELLITYREAKAGRNDERMLAEVKASRFYNRDQASRVAFVTGGAGAIGQQVVRLLLKLGYRVFVFGHDAHSLNFPEGSDDVPMSKRAFAGFDVDLCSDDSTLFSLMREIYEDAIAPAKIDLFISCHGVMAAPFKLNGRNQESHMALNLFANVHLCRHILDQFASDDCRMVLLSSSTLHAAFPLPEDFSKDRFSCSYSNSYHAYSFSKFCLSLFANLEVERKRKANEPCNMITLHPGVVPSALYRNVNLVSRIFITRFLHYFLRTSKRAAFDVVLSAHADTFESGQYYEYGASVPFTDSVSSDANSEFMKLLD